VQYPILDIVYASTYTPFIYMWHRCLLEWSKNPFICVHCTKYQPKNTQTIFIYYIFKQYIFAYVQYEKSYTYWILIGLVIYYNIFKIQRHVLPQYICRSGSCRRETIQSFMYLSVPLCTFSLLLISNKFVFQFTALCTILPHCVQSYRTVYNLIALGP